MRISVEIVGFGKGRSGGCERGATGQCMDRVLAKRAKARCCQCLVSVTIGAVVSVFVVAVTSELGNEIE